VTAMDCAQLAEAAPELALGVLSGDERAAAVTHLNGCGSCQQMVSSLTGVTDRLLHVLAPSIEPPVGFEERVLAPLIEDAAPIAPRHRARGLAAVGPLAVAALAVAACVVLLAAVLGVSRSGGSSVVTGEMRTSRGEVVGEVYLHEQSSAVLSMTLPGWVDQIGRYAQPDTTYAVRLQRTDGPDRLLPVVMNGQSSWATALDVDPHAITSVALVDNRGYVWCQAQLATS
jgi:hypothetical protein